MKEPKRTYGNTHSNVTNQWNNLPNYVVNAPSLNTFKNHLDKLWESEDVLYDPDIDISTNNKIHHYT